MKISCLIVFAKGGDTLIEQSICKSYKNILYYFLNENIVNWSMRVGLLESLMSVAHRDCHIFSFVL